MDKTNTYPVASPVWAKRDKIWFRCTSCREVHHGLPEISFELPEAVAALSKGARRRRVLLDGDVAILDGTRYFFRATLSAPVIGCDHDVTWGVWVEAGWSAFKSYWQHLAADGMGDVDELKPFKARLATTIAGLGTTRGLSGEISGSDDGARPVFTLSATAKTVSHPLLKAQEAGVTQAFALEQARKVGVLMLVT